MGKISLIVMILAFVILLSGCAQPGVLEVQVVAPETTPGSKPGTDVPVDLEPLVQVMLTGDGAARAETVQLLKTNCTDVQGLGGPPPCENGEKPGDLVTVFPLGGPEGHFVRPDKLADVLSFEVKALFAIYRAPAPVVLEPFWPAGEYALLFEGEPGPSSMAQAVVVLARGGRIVRIDFPIGQHPGEIFARVPLADVVVPPTQAQLEAFPVLPTPTPEPFSLDLQSFGPPLEWSVYDGSGYQLIVDPRWTFAVKGEEVQFTAPESAPFSVTLAVVPDERSLEAVRSAYGQAGTQSSPVTVDGREGVAFLSRDGRLDVFVAEESSTLHLYSDMGMASDVLAVISSLKFDK